MNLTKPTEIGRIYRIDDRNSWIFCREEFEGSEHLSGLYTESYIVTNPPSDEKELKKLIEDYIEDNDLYRLSTPFEIPAFLEASSFSRYTTLEVKWIRLRFFKQSLKTPLIWADPMEGTDKDFACRETDLIATDDYSYEYLGTNDGITCFSENAKSNIWDLIFMPAFTPKGWNDPPE